MENQDRTLIAYLSEIEDPRIGRTKRHKLELPNGIPSHDIFGRVFARIDPEQFRKSIMGWGWHSKMVCRMGGQVSNMTTTVQRIMHMAVMKFGSVGQFLVMTIFAICVALP